MAETKEKKPLFLFILLLCVGFAGLCLPNLLGNTVATGVSSFVWILAFLLVTGWWTSRRETLISGAVFVVGYFLRFFGTAGDGLVLALAFAVIGGIQFCVFWVYSRLVRKVGKGIITLAFPLLWNALYLLAMLVRFPSLLRPDILFSDMTMLMQSESLLGTFGLSFVVLWIPALVAFAIGCQKLRPGVIAATVYIVLLIFGSVTLYPNVTGGDTVKVALSTGPYVGDYLNYTTLPVERYLESMSAAAAEAKAQGAEILVFNEETYEIDDTEEEAFLTECRLTARENGLHMLVGLDVGDTDESNGGLSLNKAVWIDPDGNILDTYQKSRTIPLLEADYENGDGRIPSQVITAGGKEIWVSWLICYDSNFPLLVNSMPEDTDILFLPSWDWAAVTASHASLCRTIAAENRVSVVKPTYDGISVGIRPDGTVIDSFNTNDIGYEQVRIMEVPLGGLDGMITAVGDKTPYIYAIIAVEIMSLLICLILLYGNRFEARRRTFRNRLFAHAVICCMIGLGADAVSWIFDGCVRLEPMLYVSTVISLVMTFILDGVFIYYVMEYIREKTGETSAVPRVYMIILILVALIIVALSGTGLLFTFENGVYVEGSLYSAYIIVNLLCSVFCLVVNLLHMRSLTWHDRIATLSFILIPWVEALTNLKYETFSYAYPAIVLALAIMYVVIQSERQNQLAVERSVSFYHARHDALTGLANRLAYEERLKALKDSEGTVGVVYSDVNGLKVTNDHYGHEAGDQLLVDYAKLMGRYFRKDEIFRISGDEFTVLLANMSEEALRARMEEFRKALVTDGVAMASVGFSFGDSKDTDALIREAEMEMYHNKAEFHRQHPEMTRTDADEAAPESGT